MKTHPPFNIGDIIESVFWQGYQYEGTHKIRSCEYRIISRDLVKGDRSFIDELNDVKYRFMPPDNWCYTVVPARIPVGKETKKDRGWLNHYIPTLHPKIMRDVHTPWDYLILKRSAAGAQTTLF